MWVKVMRGITYITEFKLMNSNYYVDDMKEDLEKADR